MVVLKVHLQGMHWARWALHLMSHQEMNRYQKLYGSGTDTGAYDDEQSVETENTENNHDLIGVHHTKHTHYSIGSI